jgi:hypothetical protein
MRSAYQGGWGSLLVGFCNGGKESAMAGFGDQPTPRRAIDWRATDPGARLWPRRENPAGNRRTLKLQQPSSEGLQGGASHRQGRSSEVGAWRRVMSARVIKRYQHRRVVEVMRRVVAGSEAEVISRVIATQRSMLALINTELTSSACRPPCAPGWLLWCVGAAPGHTSTVG